MSEKDKRRPAAIGVIPAQAHGNWFQRCIVAQLLQVRTLVICGLMISISIILSRFLSVSVIIGGIKGINLGLGLLPIILSGLLFGPAAGFFVGACADLLGALLFPSGAYFPGFTLCSALSGFLPALFFYTTRCPLKLFILLPVLLVSQGISSVLLNTYWITILSGKLYMVLLPARAITQAILIPIFAMLSLLLYQSYMRVIRR